MWIAMPAVALTIYFDDGTLPGLLTRPGAVAGIAAALSLLMNRLCRGCWIRPSLLILWLHRRTGR